MVFMLIGGCTISQKESSTVGNPSGEVRLMAAADLHHLSETLYDPSSEVFLKLKTTNDGKLFEKSTAILEALEQKAVQEKPDALLLAGDLTFNGERVSLNEAAQVFSRIEEAGIPVYVISGNHDILYPGAASFFGSEAEAARQISPDDFAEVMADFGFSQALSRDPSSLSYMAQIREDVWLLVLDANIPGHTGTVLSDTLLWAQPLLEKAQKEGIRVIAMSHQNVLIQNDYLYDGFVINNHEAVENMLRKYGVQLVLSGHSHLEHTSEHNGLTDICLESLAVYPLQYGMITIPADRNGFAYEKRKLGVLEQEAYECFAETVFSRTKETIEKATDDPAEQERMAAFAAAVNSAYFAGDYAKIQTLADDPGRALWSKKAGDTFFGYYLESIFREAE